jgi:hypothetical protein
MATCEYEQWNKKTKKMQVCGHDGKVIMIPDIKIMKGRATGNGGYNKDCVCLCPEHESFIKDCLMTDYYIAKKKYKNKQLRLNLKK